ncbi:MAG: hypothetical protein ACPL4H_06925 [Anaerolineales bacterium]
MRHQLFEEWLFSKDDLDSQQKELLYHHTQTCQHCQTMETAWNELMLHIDTKIWYSPDEGFAQRWQSRLKQYQILEQQKHAYWAFMLTAGGAFLFAIPLLLSVILTSPLTEIWTAFYRVSTIAQFAQDLVSFLLTLIRPLGILIPTALGLGFIFTAWSGLFLWLVLMQRVYFLRSREDDNA